METINISVELKMEDLYAFTEAYKAIEHGQKSKIKIDLPKPIKPIYKIGMISTDVRKLADELEQHENSMVSYLKEKDYVVSYNNIIEDMIMEYIKSHSGLNDLPKQYQDKIWNIAWNKGHSDGLYAVYQELLNLVEIFN